MGCRAPWRGRQSFGTTIISISILKSTSINSIIISPVIVIISSSCIIIIIIIVIIIVIIMVVISSGSRAPWRGRQSSARARRLYFMPGFYYHFNNLRS